MLLVQQAMSPGSYEVNNQALFSRLQTPKIWCYSCYLVEEYSNRAFAKAAKV